MRVDMYVWVGAAITAALFIAGRYAIALYLAYAAPASTYGAAGVDWECSDATIVLVS